MVEVVEVSILPPLPVEVSESQFLALWGVVEVVEVVEVYMVGTWRVYRHFLMKSGAKSVYLRADGSLQGGNRYRC